MITVKQHENKFNLLAAETVSTSLPYCCVGVRTINCMDNDVLLVKCFISVPVVCQ